MPAYIPVTALCSALLTAWFCATILWQIRIERQVQREREGHEPHPAVRRRLRLAKARRLVPSRPARGPRRAASLRRRVLTRQR